MSSPTFFGEGSTPRVSDTRWRILQKILGATIDAGTGGGVGSLITQAATAPPVDGSVTTIFFRNTSTGQKYMNTGTVAVPAWEAI